MNYDKANDKIKFEDENFIVEYIPELDGIEGWSTCKHCNNRFWYSVHTEEGFGYDYDALSKRVKGLKMVCPKCGATK